MSTITPTSQPATSSPLRRLINGHPLVTYFVIAFAGTWLVADIPLLLAKNGFGVLPFTFPDLGRLGLGTLGTFCGPTFGALIVTAATSGAAGVRKFLRRFLQWRVGVLWYVLALFSFLAIFLLSAIVAPGPGVLVTFIQQWSQLFTVFLPTAVLFIPVVALWEEPGWRGFALPRLQRRYGPVLGTIVLGTLHSFWHLPTGWIVDGPLYPFAITTFVTFVLTGIAGSFLYTWIYNHAKGSILIAILIHSASNAASNYLDRLVPNSQLSGLAHALFYDYWNNVIAFGAVAVLLIIFTRGRLGFNPERNAQLFEVPRPAETSSTVEVEHSGLS